MEEVRWGVSSGIDYVERLPHFHRAKVASREENVAWRLEVREACNGNVALQKKIRKMCEEDALFFINLFCYVVEPRETESGSGLLPFWTWPHQNCIIAAICDPENWGKRHAVGHKSRAQGATWILAAIMVWAFLFKPNCILGFGSKDMETADDPGDPRSIGWKIDLLLEKLPVWLRPDGLTGHRPLYRSSSKHTWRNIENGATIAAYSATAGIARGGRYTMFFLDESAFFPVGTDAEAVNNLVRTTGMLIMISTPNGMNNEHYDRVTAEKSSWMRLTMHWRDNPEQNRGLYTVENGQLLVIDHEYDYATVPKRYVHKYDADTGAGFNLDGRIRSPWYDQQCEEHGNNMLYIAQELDIEYHGSKGRPFGKELLNNNQRTCLEPFHTGHLEYLDYDPTRLREHRWFEGPGLKFDLWVTLGADGRPPQGKYIVGCDIATGTGGETSSNSVASVWDISSGVPVQVGEYARHDRPAEVFARDVLAICGWFSHGKNDAYLIWERNGAGGVMFTRAISELGYSSVYLQKSGKDERLHTQRKDVPGYFNSSRSIVLAPLIEAMQQGLLTIRSQALIEECAQYVYDDQTGKPVHPRARTTRDGSSKNDNHGDRTIAAALAVRAMHDKMSMGHKKVHEIKEKRYMGPNSIYGRMREREKQSKLRKGLRSCAF